MDYEQALKDARKALIDLIQGPPLDDYDMAISEIVEFIESKIQHE